MKASLCRSSAAVFCVIALLAIVLPNSALAQVRVIQEVKHDVSAPLAELHRLTPAQPNPFSPRVLKVLPTGPARAAAPSAVPDAALQQNVLPPVAATLGLSIEGLGLGQYGFLMQFAPPDTNGTVGATQYTQWVNAEFAVFNKTTGALIAGPTFGNALWAGFGGGCQTNNDGDPIVQYDKIANRWILTQFSVSTLPYLQCVAVSTTSDATGTYNRYAFSFGNSNFPDYPKMSVWPDAYYISFNMFLNGASFIGSDACAMDRAAMLAGTTAKIICFQQNSSIASLLPSDMDGTIQPAAGEPGFFMNFGTNSVRLWKFHADFATPTNSTFSGPTSLAVAAFTQQCTSACIPQPAASSFLDALGDRPMYRLAYRKFSDGHESLVFNHSVTTGVRWYEIQKPNGTPTVFQQGTFAPDASKRWMGGIAMDQTGDIALGYSVSSTSVHPSVYFTGRIPSDTAGSMESEQLVVAGTGSQNGGLSRWGDYSAMTIDPADDCTFWYTQEYIKADGSFNWNTRIANFKFANCGGGGGNPIVALSPTSLAFGKVLIGQTSASQTVTLTNTGNATLNLSSVAVTANYAIQANTCGAQVLAGNKCTVTLAFKPTKKNILAGTLSFTDNAAGSPQKVSLTGTGVSISLTPTGLSFGSVTVGQTSAPQSVAVANVSAVSVNLTSIKITGTTTDYSISANTCGASLAGGANCSVSVVFHPTKKGARAGKLNIANNGGGGNALAALSGTGQ